MNREVYCSLTVTEVAAAVHEKIAAMHAQRLVKDMLKSGPLDLLFSGTMLKSDVVLTLMRYGAEHPDTMRLIDEQLQDCVDPDSRADIDGFNHDISRVLEDAWRLLLRGNHKHWIDENGDVLPNSKCTPVEGVDAPTA